MYKHSSDHYVCETKSKVISPANSSVDNKGPMHYGEPHKTHSLLLDELDEKRGKPHANRTR